jgi:glycosyltransferase involved in cell wall biosynthesis/SAM-dependent methyltransferase
MDVCTIIAKNYVAHARVLARSFAEHHPDGRLWVLVVDDYANHLNPDVEPFRLLSPADIGCDPFPRMACAYNVLELSTAVKPWLLRYVLAQGAQVATYLDPDICIYGSLERLVASAEEHGLVLTPHNAKAIPPDGERPSQVDILIAGVYNLGYISVASGPETEGLLDWWSDRLRRDCRIDPVYGYFVDQRWFDLAPGLVSDYAIVRDPEYNLAYWNVHSYEFTHGEGQYRVDGRPLRFFHFSGFDPMEPSVLSRHQTRVRLSDCPALAQLCREYAQQVMAEGHVRAREWSYTYDRLADGTRFTDLLRRLYAAGEGAPELSDSPFSEPGCRRFLGWLQEVPEGAPGPLNRALTAIYESRPDLRAAYPDIENQDRDGFVEWVEACDDPELDLPPALTASTQPTPSPTPTVAATAQLPEQWGVNVIGYFRSELGVGEAARQVVKALDAGGIPVLPVHGQTIPPNRQGHAFTHLRPRDAYFPINLICMNADVLPEFATQVADEAFFRGRYSIGLWFWEVTTFPSRWLSSFELLDEVWVPSQHVADAVTPVSPLPTLQVTIPVTMPPVARRDRRLLGLPDGFAFLFTFDYNSVFERKNPLATVAAFTQAFEPGSGASLTIKCINEDRDPSNHERVKVAAAAHPDVHLLDGYLAPDEKNSLMAACDCYVSLHRSEGFGLTMAEAMFLGKPVIATGYSGNLDFMNRDNSHLVAYDLVAIGGDAAPYPAEGEWARPDVDHAAQLMRAVFTDQSAAAELGRRAAAEIRTSHSPAAAGQQMARRLERVRARRGLSTDIVPPPGALEMLPERLASGPMPGTHRRMYPGRELVRRLVLRVMRPFTAFQSTVNAELLQSLQELWRNAAEVHAKLVSSVVQSLAEQRGRHEQLLLSEAVTQRVDELQRDVVDLAGSGGVTDRMDELVRRIDAVRHDVDAVTVFHDPIIERIDGLDRAVQQIEADSHAIPYMKDAPFSGIQHPQVGVVQGYRHGDLEVDRDENYRAFEDTFRGSEEFIRDRQRVFLKILHGRAPVLDFGCGRGEFLDLLAEHGIPYVGVDTDAGMVRRCREKGHREVVHGDGLDYLDALTDGSLGAIFCAQVIEHLTYDALVRLLGLARLKLSADGIFLAETVNPHSVAALKTFWVDPTHQHPIFPEVALSLCRAAGFAAAFVFHPNGTGDVERDRFTQGEYAIVAGRATLLASPTLDDEDRLERADQTLRPASKSSHHVVRSVLPSTPRSANEHTSGRS